MTKEKKPAKTSEESLFENMLLFPLGKVSRLGQVALDVISMLLKAGRVTRSKFKKPNIKNIKINIIRTDLKSFYAGIRTKLSKIKISGKLKKTKRTKKPQSKKKTKQKPKVVKKSAPKKTTKQVSKRSRSRILRPVGAFLLGSFITFMVTVVPAYAYIWYKELPQPELLAQQGHNKSTKILDRKGRLLYEIYVDKKYDPIELEQVPDHVIQATLAVEDTNFYTHHGFNFTSIVRAAKATLVDDNLQGASTITQQLIKNVLLTPERTISRKAKEIVLAVLVEREYTKNEILELYLNNIPYGGTAYGVQAASQKYFGKDVWDLDLAEATMLAGLPSAPSIYSPVSGDYSLAKDRQKITLERMLALGYITKAEAEAAYAQELAFAPQTDYIRAPHFVTHVRNELYRMYGQRMVDFGGLTVTTTLDLDLQEKVQDIVREEVKNHAQYNISNGAAVVLDSRSGGILAYVGSVDYFSEEDGKYDVVTAYRQPGSSIKPVTYALAFEKGYTSATLINDSKVSYQSYGQVYSPKNYDNKFHGLVTLRQALANSYNVPAVKLLNTIGVHNMVKLGTELGLSNWVPEDNSYGLSVTLGGKEVRLLDLTNVYATFSRGGIYKETTPFITIKDSYGFVVYDLSRVQERRVLKPETAYIITNILSDNAARTPAFGTNSKLVITGHTVAVKTGTTNDIRDNLTFGYTPSYTVGVWVGNNNNEAMNKRLASGLTGAAPIWNRVFSVVLEDTPNEPFIVPEGIVTKQDLACNRVEVFNREFKIPESLCGNVKTARAESDDKDKKPTQNNGRNNR